MKFNSTSFSTIFNFSYFSFCSFCSFYRLWWKIVKEFTIENWKFWKKNSIRYCDTWKFWLLARLQKLETQLFKSFRCSLFLILLHSCIHWRIVWRIDRISHWLLLYKEYLIAYFLAPFFFLLCLSWHTNDESISIQLKIDYEKTLWKKLNIPRNAKNDTFR